jgi:hypothetical protein
MLNWTLQFVAPELKEILGIPKDHTIGYVLIFGKPTTIYSRGIQSDGIHINKISL